MFFFWSLYIHLHLFRQNQWWFSISIHCNNYEQKICSGLVAIPFRPARKCSPHWLPVPRESCPSLQRTGTELSGPGAVLSLCAELVIQGSNTTLKNQKPTRCGGMIEKTKQILLKQGKTGWIWHGFTIGITEETIGQSTGMAINYYPSRLTLEKCPQVGWLNVKPLVLAEMV